MAVPMAVPMAAQKVVKMAVLSALHWVYHLAVLSAIRRVLLKVDERAGSTVVQMVVL